MTCEVTGCTMPGQGLCKVHLADVVDALRRLATGGVLRARVHYRHDYSRGPLTVACPDCNSAAGAECVDPATARALLAGSHAKRRWRATVIATTRVETRPGLYEDLVDALARKDHIGGDSIPTVTTHADLGIPFGDAAAAVKDQVDATISAWSRDVARTFGRELTATTVREAARWLAGNSTLLARHPEAGQLHNAVTALVRLADRVIDRAERVYVGRCDPDNPETPCEQDLYVLPNRAVVQCPVCGTPWDVRARRDFLLTKAEDQLAPAGDIARALTRLGQRVTAAMIRGYAHRGSLRQYKPHPLDRHKLPRYRVGDVRHLIESADQEEAI